MNHLSLKNLACLDGVMLLGNVTTKIHYMIEMMCLDGVRVIFLSAGHILTTKRLVAHKNKKNEPCASNSNYSNELLTGEKMGCKCQKCEKIFNIDMNVHNDIWEKIKPYQKSVGAGLLCPSCVIDRLCEALGDSEGQTINEIKIELRKDGVPVDEKIAFLLKKQKEISKKTKLY